MSSKAQIESHKRWRLANPEKVRSYRLTTRYGITASQWNVLFASQGNACAVCKKTKSDLGRRGRPELPKRFAVDHEHATGAVRGILCQNCNRAAGMLEDNPVLARALAAYLESYFLKATA